MEKNHSLFWKNILNNKLITRCLIILLLLLMLLVFTKVSHLFYPIVQFFSIIGLPVILAGLFYYLLNPIVDYFELKKIKRVWSIVILFVVMLLLLIISVGFLIPEIKKQVLSFVDNYPEYISMISTSFESILKSSIFEPFYDVLEDFFENIFSYISNPLQEMSSELFQSLGELVAKVANILIGLVTAPIILFFLLKDGHYLGGYLVNFLPDRYQRSILEILKEMSLQIASYVRGQLTVAFAVAIMFTVGFSIVGLDYAVTLGILAGILNMIPYLGSFLAMLPVVFLGIAIGPAMLIKVLIVFIIEQTIESRLISPLVLGSQLNMHPVTILVVLLSAGKIFGVVGVIMGIPVYALVKVIVSHLFKWYKEHSPLYSSEKETLND